MDVDEYFREKHNSNSKNKLNFDTITEPDLFAVSENISKNGPKNKSNNLSKLDMKSKRAQVPEYASQFEVQTFDSVMPGAANDTYESTDKANLADLERKISYGEGWAQYTDDTMTYGIFPDDKLTHNNMVPHFSNKGTYGSNELYNEGAMNYKTHLFTGNLKNTWNHKKEVQPMFKPAANISHPYGKPCYSEEEVTRYQSNIGQRQNNVKPFQPVQVTPGLNLGANEIGTHGYHSFYRPLEKTVDELRVKPRITYEGRMLGETGPTKRPVQAPVMSYRPQTYKVNTAADVLPTGADVDGPKSIPNYNLKVPNKATQLIEYTGAAYSTDQRVNRNVPEELKSKHKSSTKATFKLPKPLHKYAKSEAIYNPNQSSYNLPLTAKDMIVHNDRATNAIRTGEGTYASMTDDAKHTMKEITSSEPQKYFQIKSNTMRHTVQPMDIAKTTLKESTIDNPLNPNVSNLSAMTRVYTMDDAKATMRETTIDPVVPSNIQMQPYTYSNLTDSAKNTLKEGTVDIPRQNFISGADGYRTNLTDVARTTIREGTATIPYQTVVTGIGGHQVNPTDTARETTKSQTVQIPYHNNVTGVGGYHTNLQDSARSTLRQDTVQIPYQTMVTPMNLGYNTNLMDIARQTTKELTNNVPRQTMMTPSQYGFQSNLQDSARTTSRQETVQIPYQTVITPMNRGHTNPYTDTARSTTKQDTVQIPYQSIITGIVNRPTSHLGDTARTTTKQDTVQIPYQTNITGAHLGIHTNYTDNAKNTMRQETVQIPYHNNLTGGKMGQNPYTDTARSTIKQETVQIPYNSNVTGESKNGSAASFNHNPLVTTIREQIVHNNRSGNVSSRTGNYANLTDKAKRTLKQETVQIPYNTTVTDTRGPRSNLTDEAKRTMKQETVQIPYNTNVTAVSKQKGAADSHHRNPLESTLKETIVDNNRDAAPSLDNDVHGHGYLAESHFAPNTNRQFTCQEVYITPLNGESKHRSQLDYENAQINSKREELQQYRAPTSCGVAMGPTAESMNVRLRENSHKPREPMIYSAENSADRMQPQTQMRVNNTFDSARFIDPALLTQLESNPYNIKYQY